MDSFENESEDNPARAWPFDGDDRSPIHDLRDELTELKEIATNPLDLQKIDQLLDRIDPMLTMIDEMYFEE